MRSGPDPTPIALVLALAVGTGCAQDVVVAGGGELPAVRVVSATPLDGFLVLAWLLPRDGGEVEVDVALSERVVARGGEPTVVPLGAATLPSDWWCLPKGSAPCDVEGAPACLLVAPSPIPPGPTIVREIAPVAAAGEMVVEIRTRVEGGIPLPRTSDFEVREPSVGRAVYQLIEDFTHEVERAEPALFFEGCSGDCSEISHCGFDALVPH